MNPETAALELASRWSRGSVQLTRAARRVFSLGPAVGDEIVTTNRLILILRGKLDYTAEGKTIRMGAGTQFFVPAWVRRVWSVPRGGPCEIIWCEFDDGGMESGWAACRLRKLDRGEFAFEKKQYRNLVRRFGEEGDGEWKRLGLEAELKTMLVRFLENMESTPQETERSRRGRRAASPFHPRVKQMLKWVGEHFQEEGVLEGLYRESGMTHNYFRKLFSEAMQCSPHVHIERLRLRHARYLLRETDRPVKQVAAACGYRDALYFSRIYHRFWGRPPGREREDSGGD